MQRFPLIITACLAIGGLTGCMPMLSPIEQKWHAQKTKDDFTGEEACRITTWLQVDGGLGFRPANELYPVVEMRNYELLVGVMTAPMQVGTQQIASPSGDVQIKIDDNEAWTLAAIDTPVSPVAGGSSEIMATRTQQNMAAAMANVPGGSANVPNMAAMMSQYGGMTASMTLASGYKAHQIFAQMKAGKTIKYRRMPNAVVTSATQQFPLEGFNEAAKVCGL